MKALVLALALFGCGWTPRQKLTAGAMVATLTIDWRQTGYITGRCTESNPILGECGQRLHKDVYFPLVTAAALILAHELPQWRDVILGGVTGAETATIWSNATGTNAVPLW